MRAIIDGLTSPHTHDTAQHDCPALFVQVMRAITAKGTIKPWYIFVQLLRSDNKRHLLKAGIPERNIVSVQATNSV